MPDLRPTSNDQEEDHYYISGKQYPRMTRVLSVIAKPEFYRWYANNGYQHCQHIMNTRAAFGTRVHKEIQNYLEGKPVWVDNEEMRQSLLAFGNWSKKHQLVPLSLEETLHCDDLRIAGTADYVGLFTSTRTKPWGKKKKVRILLDWKTSKSVFKNYHLQVAGYMLSLIHI